MNEDKKEVFRGHFAECLAHLSETMASCAPKGTHESAQAKRPVADFCGVDCGTVGKWMRGDNMPVGEQYLKMMCYLDTVGYRVIELERMPKVFRNIAELIGFNVASAQQVTDLLQYTGNNKLFAILRGDLGISPERERQAFDYWKQRRKDLEEKKEDARKQYRQGTAPKASAEAPTSLRMGMRAHRKPAALSIMEGLLGLLEDGLFERSQDNLTALEESVDTVLNLSARLNVLSSQLITLKERKEVPHGE